MTVADRRVRVVALLLLNSARKILNGAVHKLAHMTHESSMAYQISLPARGIFISDCPISKCCSKPDGWRVYPLTRGNEVRGVHVIRWLNQSLGKH